MLVMSDQTLRLTLRLALRKRVVDALLDVLEEYLRRYPVPKKYTPAEIEGLLHGGYYRQPGTKFWHEGESLRPGDHVLWMGLKKSRHGEPSTKEQYFSGQFHGWRGRGDIIS